MDPATRCLVETLEIADKPYNAFLLRADLHALFDDYQWGLLVCYLPSTFFAFAILKATI